MKAGIKENFIEKWYKYFGDVELPITFYYSESDNDVEKFIAPKGRSCIICELKAVRNGKSLCFNEENVKCRGAKKYVGFSDKIMDDFEFFLSCGVEGELEGERYKKTPDIVLQMMHHQVNFDFKAKNLIFKRWDMLNENDNPEVVIFFATPDTLSGLFTLANYDHHEPNGVHAPFSSGCGSIIHYPYLERNTLRPRGILGMFDPSARTCVDSNELSFALPFERFEEMVDFMDQSFLITKTWGKIGYRGGKVN